MSDSTTIKEKILSAAVDLMREDDVNITVRKIAARAGVTPGLINYHYQSKDRLIDIAAQAFVDETVSRFSQSMEETGGDPTELLKEKMKMTLQYLAEHPNVSRVSILRDLTDARPDDNMHSSILAFDKILRRILRGKKKRFLAGHIFVSAMQGLFMRADLLRETQGFDINDPEARGKFIDEMVETVLRGLEA